MLSSVSPEHRNEPRHRHVGARPRRRWRRSPSRSTRRADAVGRVLAIAGGPDGGAGGLINGGWRSLLAWALGRSVRFTRTEEARGRGGLGDIDIDNVGWSLRPLPCSPPPALRSVKSCRSTAWLHPRLWSVASATVFAEAPFYPFGFSICVQARRPALRVAKAAPAAHLRDCEGPDGPGRDGAEALARQLG